MNGMNFMCLLMLSKTDFDHILQLYMVSTMMV
jgi:hypothetical protein